MMIGVAGNPKMAALGADLQKELEAGKRCASNGHPCNFPLCVYSLISKVQSHVSRSIHHHNSTSRHSL